MHVASKAYYHPNAVKCYLICTALLLMYFKTPFQSTMSISIVMVLIIILGKLAHYLLQQNYSVNECIQKMTTCTEKKIQ